MSDRGNVPPGVDIHASWDNDRLQQRRVYISAALGNLAENATQSERQMRNELMDIGAILVQRGVDKPDSAEEPKIDMSEFEALFQSPDE